MRFQRSSKKERIARVYYFVDLFARLPTKEIDETIISFVSRIFSFADARSGAAKNEGFTVVPIAYTVKEVCSLSRVGKTTLYAAIGRGELVARKLGKKTLILEVDFRRWIEALPTINSASL